MFFGAFDLVLADGFFANSVLENSYFSSMFIKVSTTREVDVNPAAGRNVSGPKIWHFGSNFNISAMFLQCFRKVISR